MPTLPYISLSLGDFVLLLYFCLKFLVQSFCTNFYIVLMSVPLKSDIASLPDCVFKVFLGLQLILRITVVKPY